MAKQPRSKMLQRADALVNKPYMDLGSQFLVLDILQMGLQMSVAQNAGWGLSEKYPLQVYVLLPA